MSVVAGFSCDYRTNNEVCETSHLQRFPSLEKKKIIKTSASARNNFRRKLARFIAARE